MGLKTKMDNPIERFFGPAIRDMITRAVQDEVDKSIPDIKEKIHMRLAKEVTTMSLSLMEYVSMETLGHNLVIRIEMPKKEEIKS